MKSIWRTLIILVVAVFMTACGHEHSFGEWSTVKEATCTEEGIRERSCKCGEKETESIAPSGHSFGEWKAVREATCTEEGVRERSCKCGEKESETIPATGHNFGEWIVVTEATCVSDGLRERTCSCGESESETIPQTDPVLSCPCFKINGVYVDESKTQDGKDVVYLFYTLSAETTNLTANQLLIDVVVNKTNTYNPAVSKRYIPYYTGYYYSAYNKDIYVGSSLDVCQAYEIGTGDLADGKLITLKSSNIDVDEIQFPASEVKRMAGMEEIAKDLDADVYAAKYAEYEAMMAETDSATERAVKNGLNNYYWTFYAYPSSYTLEFSSPNYFSIRAGFGLSNTGTYTVHAGCIVLYYPSNGNEIIVPFTCNADGTPAFDSNGSLMMPTLPNQFVVDPDYDGRE